MVNPFTKNKAITVFGTASTALFLALNLLAPQFVEERVESLLTDFRFQLRNVMSPPAVPQDIVIVEVDEKSLEKYGRWPWSRVRQAKLIDQAVACGVVGMFLIPVVGLPGAALAALIFVGAAAVEA